MAVNDFNFIAPFYDVLARIVFGNSILKAQTAHLSEIKENDQVLILGGGTGKILENFPFCEHIDYVEKSGKMIRIAKRRLVNRSVNFVNHDFLNWKSDATYDVIVCPFFLDCFDEQSLNTVIIKAKELLGTDGKLIVSDFDKKSINLFMLQSMLIFFKWFANLETMQLIDLRTFLLKNDFQENEIKFYKKGVFSALYAQVGKRKR